MAGGGQQGHHAFVRIPGPDVTDTTQGGTGHREDQLVPPVHTDPKKACGNRKFSSRTPEPHGLVGSTLRATFKVGVSVEKYPCRPSSSTKEVGSLGEIQCSSTKLARNDLRFPSRKRSGGGYTYNSVKILPILH